MTDEPMCARPACGHPESDHDSEIGFCDECMCTGFLSEDAFEPDDVEVPELHLGEES